MFKWKGTETWSYSAFDGWERLKVDPLDEYLDGDN